MFKLRSSNAWIRDKLILLTPLFRARRNRAKMAATTTRKTGRPRTCGCTCCRGTRTSRPASPGPTTRSTSEAECPTPIRAITITTPRTARRRRRRRRRRWTSPGSTATPDSWRLRSTERFIFCFHVPAIQWKLIKVGMSHTVFLESALIYRCKKIFVTTWTQRCHDSCQIAEERGCAGSLLRVPTFRLPSTVHVCIQICGPAL